MDLLDDEFAYPKLDEFIFKVFIDLLDSDIDDDEDDDMSILEKMEK